MKHVLFRLAPVLALLASAPDAQVIRVPSEQSTIQAALDAATPGTTVLVAPGVYPETLSWPAVDGIRLVSEQGAGATTIDARGVDRVVLMRPPLTRLTVLQGFTITGGSPPGGVIAVGGGIAINGCSPSIRFNKIVENQCLGGIVMGAGIYVDEGGAPLIEHNTISENDATGTFLPLLALGGGLYAGADTQPDLYANTIRLNEARDASTCAGGGICLESASAVIAGNHIAQNIARGGVTVAGGGIYVVDSLSQITNNTIADNHVSSGTTQNGGGITAASGTTQFDNNIVAHNTVGIDALPGAVFTLDFNDVWNNAVANYVGVAPGANDISVDPQFQTGKFRHLKSTSPCIDTGSDLLVHPLSWMDIDTDSRRTDGDLDGPAGNGARVDIGADEYSHVGLVTTGSIAVGSTVQFHTTAPGPWLYGLVLGFFPTALPLDSWGILLVGGPPYVILGVGTTPGAVPLNIPPWPSLRGLVMYAQSLVVTPADPSIGNLSNRWEGTIY